MIQNYNKLHTITISSGALLRLIALLLYVVLGLYNIYGLANSTDYRAGYDFNIYFRALNSAQAEQSPYLPHKTSQSLLYHPFSLVFLSIFSWLGPRGALALWVALSAAAWIAALVLLIRLSTAESDLLTNRWPTWTIWAIFLAFAPFWETLYMGQINAFVVLALVATFYFCEHKSSNLAGIFLGIAILLKLSPIILLPYFFVIRKYRIIGVSLITIVILTAVAAFQFGWFVVEDFFAILPVLAAEIRPTKHNQSILSLTYRLLSLFTELGLQNALVLFHKALFAGMLSVLLLMSFNNKSWAHQARLWFFAILVVLVTISSPLVWYHHNIILVIPLLFMMRSRSNYIPGLSLIVIALIQGNRLFELYVGRYALPALLAHFITFGAVATLFVKAVEPRIQRLPIWLALGFLSLLLLTGATLQDDEGVPLSQIVAQRFSPLELISADFRVVRLEGYRLDVTHLQVRSEIYLTTYWQPQSPFAEVSDLFPVKVFVHLRKSNNDVVAQADHMLFGEAGDPQPFTGYLGIAQSWDVAKARNRSIADESTITIPAGLPPGTYQLYLGLYDPATLERYPMLNDNSGEHAVQLGNVTIPFYTSSNELIGERSVLGTIMMTEASP